jgi:hypothetical protein
MEDLPEEVQAQLNAYLHALESGICPNCGASDNNEVQVGRCVYCLECGVRMFQGYARNSIISSAPIPSVKQLRKQQKPSLLNRLFGKGKAEEPKADVQVPDIAGLWALEEKYLGGTTTGEVHLTQDGDELSGYIVIKDQPAGKQGFIVKETIIGFIQDDQMILNGTAVEVLEGETNYGSLDNWQGTIDTGTPDTIIGRSMDDRGSSGKFTMRRAS